MPMPGAGAHSSAPARRGDYRRPVLHNGDQAPDINLLDHRGEPFSLATSSGKDVLVYFYPRADTPGCTMQACGLRDILGQVGDTVILGISPDKPPALTKFREKYHLGFTLLSDVDHAVAEAFDVWQEKKNYGKTSMGIVRSAFLIGGDGLLRQVWYKISPKDTPVKLLEALGH
jgi:thioredoxin-dependent peroxiredoxin